MDKTQNSRFAKRLKLIFWANILFIIALVFACAVIGGNKIHTLTGAAHVIVPVLFVLPSVLTAAGCFLLKPLHRRFPIAGICVIAACLIGFLLPACPGCRSIAAKLNEYQALLSEPDGELLYVQAYAEGTLTALSAKYTLILGSSCLVSALIGFYPLSLSLTGAAQLYDGDGDFSRRWKKCAARLCVYLILAFLAPGFVLLSNKLEASSFAGTNYADVLLTRGSSVFGLIARIFGKICLFAAIAAYIRHTFFLDADTLLIKNENSGPSDRN